EFTRRQRSRVSDAHVYTDDLTGWFMRDVGSRIGEAYKPSPGSIFGEVCSVSCHWRVTRNFTQPHVGTKTSPHLRLSRRTDRSRMAKPSLMSFLCQVDLAK
ncbi:hypothetical protein, partial [Ferrimicrobium acidiphilum]